VAKLRCVARIGPRAATAAARLVQAGPDVELGRVAKRRQLVLFERVGRHCEREHDFPRQAMN
jgi:hypothetical protein